jgi:hypothetical protein
VLIVAAVVALGAGGVVLYRRHQRAAETAGDGSPPAADPGGPEPTDADAPTQDPPPQPPADG